MSNPLVLARLSSQDLQLWQLFNVLISGMYIWEILLTFSFDLSFLRRKRQFRWPLIPYFLCRYSLLGALVGYHVFQFSRTGINCVVLYRFIGALMDIAIGTASFCLAIRTIAIWMRNRFILIALSLICLVQWGLLLRDIYLHRARWDKQAQKCMVIPMPLSQLLFLYFPAMTFDLLVLVLTTVGLLREGPLRSQLQVLVFKQGLIYFVVAFTANLVPVILILQQASVGLGLMFTYFALFASVVSSCRMVREFLLYAEGDARREQESSRLHPASSGSPLPVHALRTLPGDNALLSTTVFPLNMSGQNSLNRPLNKKDLQISGQSDTSSERK